VKTQASMLPPPTPPPPPPPPPPPEPPLSTRGPSSKSRVLFRPSTKPKAFPLLNHVSPSGSALSDSSAATSSKGGVKRTYPSDTCASLANEEVYIWKRPCLV
jgi:hypothetical protein